MTSTTVSAPILNIRSPAPVRDYMAGLYTTVTTIIGFSVTLVGLVMVFQGQPLVGPIALVSAILLLTTAWSVRQQKPWRYRLAGAMHLIGLLAVLLILVGWLVSVLDAINTDPNTRGQTLPVILGRLSTLPITSLPLADAALLLILDGGLWLMLRSMQKTENERRIDRNYQNDAELLLQRFLSSTSARVGGFLLILLILIAYLMPRVDPYTRAIALADGDLAERLKPPDCAIGWLRMQQGLDQWTGPEPKPTSLFDFPCKHPFGMDKNGRDLMRRVLHGISVSLAVSLISVSISLLIGAVIGLTAGYLGGAWDSLLMRLMDIMLAFPTLLLAIAIVAMRGPGLENAMLAIGVVGIPAYARLARSMSIALREQEFVTAARSIGASQFRILRQHVLPNSLAPLIVQSTLGLGTAVIETAALGFLGLGQQPPLPELGKMLAESREVMTSGMWWVLVFPGITVMTIVLSFNLLGDALRDTLDPKLKGT
jgi:peptide/nickel transport system permease protein